MASFSVHQHVISLGGVSLIGGFGQGGAFEVSPDGDAFVIVKGVTGDAVRIYTGEDTYQVKFTLLQTSVNNDILSALHEADVLAAENGLAGAGVFPLLIKDLGGSTVFTSGEAFVKKPPTITGTNTATDREWELVAFGGRLHVGGNA